MLAIHTFSVFYCIGRVHEGGGVGITSSVTEVILAWISPNSKDKGVANICSEIYFDQTGCVWVFWDESRNKLGIFCWMLMNSLNYFCCCLLVREMNFIILFHPFIIVIFNTSVSVPFRRSSPFSFLIVYLKFNMGY